MKRYLQRGVLAASMLALVFMFLPGQTASSTTSCKNYNIPVSLTSDSPKNVNISAILCKPKRYTSKVDIMLHGGTYDRTYWSAGVSTDAHPYPFYSYAARTVASGRAAFYFDMVGTGKSTKPLSTDFTIDNVAFTVHQLVNWVKTRHGLNDVTLIGHSMGSFTAIHVANSWPSDAKRVVITGALHLPGEVQRLSASVGQNMHFANNEPQWSDLDSGYLTTKPGVRKSIFYYGATAEDAVVDYDEDTKDVVSFNYASAAMVDMTLPPEDNVSSGVTAHVYIILGAQDNWMCEGNFVCTEYNVKVNEAPHFRNARSIAVKVVPFTGHDLTLQTTADYSFKAIDTWIKSR